MSSRARWRRYLPALAVLLALPGAHPARADGVTNAVNADGTVHIKDMDVPLSVYLSPQAKAALLDRFAHPIPMPKISIADMSKPGPELTKWRADMDEAIFKPTVEKLKQLYPVTIEETRLAGVEVAIVSPKGGVANGHRILINLHGGGFLIGGLLSGEGEAIPIAGLGKITVVTVNYRQAPEFRYPAATEDVVAVYRELLKKYPAKNIGIYGCSAGGRLTGETVASLDKAKIPLPGAIGILCASAGLVNGDSIYTGAALTGGHVPAPMGPEGSAVPSPYFAGVKPDDADAYPVNSPALLAKFPPTLLITGSRDFEMSSALFTHTQLVKAGVDADLHVWEGLGHGFFGEFPEIPESIDALNVIVRFFDKRLGAE
jgi:monoterpene epsilon-lactone hydrolase